MELQDIRKKIDVIDTKILKLLNDRMEFALLSSKLKKVVEDKEREGKILARVQEDLGRLTDPAFCKALYTLILDKSKELQRKQYKIIAFQGEHGAYSELAAKEWDNNLIPISCAEFSNIFLGIQNDRYDYGIVPVENTLGGVVGEVNELMIGSSLFVVGAVDMRVHHSLLAIPDTNHREIKTVYSHPQALAQCRYFITRNKLEGASYYDTAGAARMLIESAPRASAAIASKYAAELYNLEIIKENIEDSDSNKTRFLILSKNENKEGGQKCSIMFKVEHKAGSLFSVLQKFAEQKINLTRIESVPGRPGSYIFFMDFEGSKNDSRVAKILEEIKRLTEDLKILGFYKERKIDK